MQPINTLDCLPGCPGVALPGFTSAPAGCPCGAGASIDLPALNCDGTTSPVSVKDEAATKVVITGQTAPMVLCVTKEFDKTILCNKTTGAKVIFVTSYDPITGVPTTVQYNLDGTINTDPVADLVECEDASAESDRVKGCDGGVPVSKWVLKVNGEPTGTVYYTNDLTNAIVTPVAWTDECVVPKDEIIGSGFVCMTTPGSGSGAGATIIVDTLTGSAAITTAQLGNGDVTITFPISPSNPLTNNVLAMATGVTGYIAWSITDNIAGMNISAYETGGAASYAVVGTNYVVTVPAGMFINGFPTSYGAFTIDAFDIKKSVTTTLPGAGAGDTHEQVQWVKTKRADGTIFDTYYTLSPSGEDLVEVAFDPVTQTLDECPVELDENAMALLTAISNNTANTVTAVNNLTTLTQTENDETQVILNQIATNTTPIIPPAKPTQTHVLVSGVNTSVPAGLKTVTIANLTGITTLPGAYTIGDGRRPDSQTYSASELDDVRAVLPAIAISGGTWQWTGLQPVAEV